MMASLFLVHFSFAHFTHFYFILKKEMAPYLHTIDIGTPNTPLSLIEGVFLIPSKEVEKDTDIFMQPPPRSNDTPRV